MGSEIGIRDRYMYEDIVINVPTDWDDDKKQILADSLKELLLPFEYRIMITNKMNINIVDTDTMDRLRGGNV